MARTTKTYNALFKEVTLNEWTTIGTGLQAKKEGEEIVEANRLEVAANAKVVQGKFNLPTLAVGEIVTKVQLKIYGKAGTGAGQNSKDCNVTTGGAIKLELEKAANAWYSTAVEAEEGTTLSAFEKFELKTIKAAGATVYAIYLIITTETERDWSNGSVGRTAATVTTAEGNYTNNGLATGQIGTTLIAYVTVAGEHGATGMTDLPGNTWTLDGEAHQGSAVAVQVWSCAVTKTLNSTDGIKLVGLPPSVKINFAMISTLTEMVSTSKVDVSGTANAAAATELEVETPATRATQGDFTAIHYGIDQEATFTPTGFISEGVLPPKQAGLTMNPGVDNKPAEGSALKYKGKYNIAGNIASLAIAYKVLASPASGARYQMML